MLDFFPILVERIGVEVGVVVVIVTAVAKMFLGKLERDFRMLARFFNFVIFCQFHVPAARSVTVFTLIPFQQSKQVIAASREFLDLKSGIVTEDELWIPTGHMAGEAFRIVGARDLIATPDNAFISVGVSGAFPFSRALVWHSPHFSAPTYVAPL